MGKENFLYWFSGFTDSEGHFGIIIDMRRKISLTFTFIIYLHIDYLQVLKLIKSELSNFAKREIGHIAIKSKAAILTFQEFNVINGLIIPIFNTFPFP